jgi:nucleoid DNA-binding protein
MRKPEIAKRLARQSGVSSAEAADQLDRVVNQILSKLRKGKTAPFPGLGKFTLGTDGTVQFKKERPGVQRRKRLPIE